MTPLIITIHVIACIFLVVLVLLQSGKEGMGVIFGGGGSSSVFGSSGAGGLLSKLTIGAATVFFITSLSYAYLGKEKREVPSESIILDQPMPPAETPSGMIDITGEPEAEIQISDDSAGQAGEEGINDAPAGQANATN